MCPNNASSDAGTMQVYLYMVMCMCSCVRTNTCDRVYMHTHLKCPFSRACSASSHTLNADVTRTCPTISVCTSSGKRESHFTTHNLQLYTFSRISLFACMFCYFLLRAWAATGIMVYKLMRWLAWCEFAPNLITTHDSSIIYLWLCVVLYPYSGKSLDRLQREKSRQIFQPLFFSTKKWTKNLRKTVCPLCAFLM